MRRRRRIRGGLPELRDRFPAARPGPHDQWLDAVAGKLAYRGLCEVTRNTGEPVADMPSEADLVAEDDAMRIVVRVFANADLAAQAEQAWSADPSEADTRATGERAGMSKGRLVVIATPRGSASVPRRAFEEAVVAVVGTSGGVMVDQRVLESGG